MNKIDNFAFLFLLLLINVFPVDAQTKEYPYKFKLGIDLSLIPSGIALKAISDVIEDDIPIYSQTKIEGLDKNDINTFDRFATDLWSPTADNVSDVFMNILISVPTALLIPEILHIREEHRWKNIVHLGLMYTEVFLLTRGITNFTQAIAQRNRPFLYNESLSIEKRVEEAQDLGAYQSFFSGHTAAAFASAVFLAKIYQDIYGKGFWSRIIWSAGLTTATVTGCLRVKSGKHYASDVIGGAVVGGAIGYLVPQVHKIKGDKIALSVNTEEIKLSVLF